MVTCCYNLVNTTLVYIIFVVSSESHGLKNDTLSVCELSTKYVKSYIATCLVNVALLYMPL